MAPSPGRFPLPNIRLTWFLSTFFPVLTEVHSYNLLHDVSVGTLPDFDNDDLVARGAVVVSEIPSSSRSKHASLLSSSTSSKTSDAQQDIEVLATETRLIRENGEEVDESESADDAFNRAVSEGSHKTPVVVPASQYQTAFFVKIASPADEVKSHMKSKFIGLRLHSSDPDTAFAEAALEKSVKNANGGQISREVKLSFSCRKAGKAVIRATMAFRGGEAKNDKKMDKKKKNRAETSVNFIKHCTGLPLLGLNVKHGKTVLVQGGMAATTSSLSSSSVSSSSKTSTGNEYDLRFSSITSFPLLISTHSHVKLSKTQLKVNGALDEKRSFISDKNNRVTLKCKKYGIGEYTTTFSPTRAFQPYAPVSVTKKVFCGKEKVGRGYLVKEVRDSREEKSNSFVVLQGEKVTSQPKDMNWNEDVKRLVVKEGDLSDHWKVECEMDGEKSSPSTLTTSFVSKQVTNKTQVVDLHFKCERSGVFKCHMRPFWGSVKEQYKGADLFFTKVCGGSRGLHVFSHDASMFGELGVSAGKWEVNAALDKTGSFVKSVGGKNNKNNNENRNTSENDKIKEKKENENNESSTSSSTLLSFPSDMTTAIFYLKAEQPIALSGEIFATNGARIVRGKKLRKIGKERKTNTNTNKNTIAIEISLPTCVSTSSSASSSSSSSSDSITPSKLIQVRIPLKNTLRDENGLTFSFRKQCTPAGLVAETEKVISDTETALVDISNEVVDRVRSYAKWSSRVEKKSLAFLNIGLEKVEHGVEKVEKRLFGEK